MLSMRLTVMAREAGFFAWMLAMAVVLPAVVPTTVHSTLISTGLLVGASAAHTSPKLMLLDDAGLLRFQVWVPAWAADMSLLSSCGEISLTGIETSLAPTPEVVTPVAVGNARLACREEPGNRCAPSASLA